MTGAAHLANSSAVSLRGRNERPWIHCTPTEKVYLFHLCFVQICETCAGLVMQEASDALIKLQAVTLFRPIRSLHCSW